MVTDKRIKLIRNHHLTKNLLVLDGLSGTGKTMMSAILQSFDRVENGRFIYDLEYISISSYLGAHRSDSVESLLDLIIDWKLYDNLISREVNFRPSDLSTIFKHPNWFEYIKRLLQDDGASVIERIEKKNPIMMIITHQLMLAMEPLIQQFKNRIKVVEMVRHPYYLLDHWIASGDIFARTPRDFTVWIDDGQGAPVPWFAQGWRDSYWSLSKFDRAVLSIESLSRDYKKIIRLKSTKPLLLYPLNTLFSRLKIMSLSLPIGLEPVPHNIRVNFAANRICQDQILMLD